MRFCGKPAHFSRQRSSTASRSNPRDDVHVHRCASCGVQSRADLRRAADRSARPLPPSAMQRSARAQRDERLRSAIHVVYTRHHAIYWARMVWHLLHRGGTTVARCTVEQLMRAEGLQGVVRGQRPITARPGTAAPCPEDLVQRRSRRTGPTSSGSPTSRRSPPSAASCSSRSWGVSRA